MHVQTKSAGFGHIRVLVLGSDNSGRNLEVTTEAMCGVFLANPLLLIGIQ